MSDKVKSATLKALQDLEDKLSKMTPEEIGKMLDERPLGDVGQFILDMQDFTASPQYAELERMIMKKPMEIHVEPSVCMQSSTGYRYSPSQSLPEAPKGGEEIVFVELRKVDEWFKLQLAEKDAEIKRLTGYLGEPGEGNRYRMMLQDNESLQSQLTFERDAKNAYLTMLEILPKLWENHQKTKFKSDGSHLQADIELNRIMVGIKDAVKK